MESYEMERKTQMLEAEAKLMQTANETNYYRWWYKAWALGCATLLVFEFMALILW